MSGIQKLREHLNAGKSITPAQASHYAWSNRLSARIADLKSEGMRIETTIKRDADGRPYAEYRKPRAIVLEDGFSLPIKTGINGDPLIDEWFRARHGLDPSKPKEVDRPPMYMIDVTEEEFEDNNPPRFTFGQRIMQWVFKSKAK